MALPLLTTAGAYWMFNALVSVPFIFISTAMATQRAFIAEDENMACYKKADQYAGEMSSRWMIQEAVMLVGAYYIRKIFLERFME